MGVKAWRTRRPQALFGAWHRLRLPVLHPGGCRCGLLDLDRVGWCEWRRQGGRRRALALLEACPLGTSLDRAIEDRRPGLEVLLDIGRRAGLPVYLLRHSPGFTRVVVHRLTGPPVRALPPVLDGTEEDLAAWLAELGEGEVEF